MHSSVGPRLRSAAIQFSGRGVEDSGNSLGHEPRMRIAIPPRNHHRLARCEDDWHRNAAASACAPGRTRPMTSTKDSLRWTFFNPMWLLAILAWAAYAVVVAATPEPVSEGTARSRPHGDCR